MQADDAMIWSVPPQWTDRSSEDPEVIISSGRAVMRFSDLVELADLVGRLSDKSAPVDAGKCKENYAATVRQITPQERQDDV